MPRFASGLLLGAVVASAFAASAASAQDNPFVPSKGPSTAEVERIIDQRMKAMEARMSALSKPATGAAGVPGSPTAAGGGPGTPIPGTPAAGSPLAPGTIAPYGAPTAVDPILTTQSQRYGVSTDRVRDLVPGIENPVFVRQQAGDVRFLGCINGVPKFVKGNGQRVVFSTRDINEAQKTGVVPTCR